MRSILRSAVAGAALLVATAGVAQAQIDFREIRIDVAGLASSDGTTMLELGGPASVSSAFLGFAAAPKLAFGIYLNKNIAIEPQLSVINFSPDGGDATTVIQVGAFVPYYLAGDYGKNGLFVSPGLSIAKVTDTDTQMDFGVDVGYKKSIRDNVSWRAAAGFRTGDSTNDELLLAASFGFSIFLK